MFPSLDYTVENAKKNFVKWQKRGDKGDKLGWNDNNNKDNSTSNVQIIEVSI